MMSAEVLPFPATVDPLAALYAERDAIQAELARFQKVDEARLSAERDLAALDGEQAVLDEAERADWSTWAAACNGPPPSPRTEAREALARKRGAAAASLASALNGAKAVEPRRVALNAEYRRIGDEVFATRVAQLTAESDQLHEVIAESAKSLLAAAARADGIRDALFLARGEAIASLNRIRIDACSNAIDAIESMVRPDLVGDANERARVAADVKRELDQ